MIDPRDNVATLLSYARAGEEVELIGSARGRVVAAEDIPRGHKVAIAMIPKGSFVLKYGETIGVATTDIGVGQHVHVHNVNSVRGRVA
ncbi:MAG: UxaA family hydrolase [Acidilobus sp.]